MISSWGVRRRLPYAFTEQGIYMLMTVLKGELAEKVGSNTHDIREIKVVDDESYAFQLSETAAQHFRFLPRDASDLFIYKLKDLLWILYGPRYP